jgi:hypothetical protein
MIFKATFPQLKRYASVAMIVARGRIELPTFRFQAGGPQTPDRPTKI